MKLQYVDSMRGIAILMVILVHSSHPITDIKTFDWLIASYGQMGVQLFFVASAFTLCLSADYRKYECNKIRNYAIRRYFRIAPLYYFGIIVYLVLDSLNNYFYTSNFILSERFSSVNILSNLTFTHGFYKPANNSVVPGGWSIATEMIFYTLFPFIHGFINKRKTNKTLVSFLVFISITLISQLTIFSISNLTNAPLQNNRFLYFSIINQLPVFCLGMLYYFYRKEMLPTLNWKLNLMFFITFSCLSIYYGFLDTNPFGHRYSVIPILSGFSFVFLFEFFRQVKKANIQVLIKIGQMSYSIYILHFISTIYLLGAIEPRLSQKLNSTYRLIIYFLITVFISYLLATFTKKYLETPFIKIGNKLISNNALNKQRF